MENHGDVDCCSRRGQWSEASAPKSSGRFPLTAAVFALRFPKLALTHTGIQMAPKSIFARQIPARYTDKMYTFSLHEKRSFSRSEETELCCSRGSGSRVWHLGRSSDVALFWFDELHTLWSRPNRTKGTRPTTTKELERGKSLRSKYEDTSKAYVACGRKAVLYPPARAERMLAASKLVSMPRLTVSHST